MRELRVHGPPGTGKTTYLKRRVEATVKERSPHAIRIASMTRAAAAEIASRVELPPEYVGTLHSHAFHALDRPDLAETREGLRAWNDYARQIAHGLMVPERGNIDATLDDAGGEGFNARSEGEALLQQYGVYRNRQLNRELWLPTVRAFAEHWERFKSTHKLLDFADLIEQAIADVPTLPGMPQVFLVDEAQDMSRLEMRLARQWGEQCETFVVVGDPYQNLYQWRGSEPEAFDADIDGDRVSVLDQSWRVPRAVHSYAVRWLNRTLSGGLQVEYKPRDHEGTVRRSPEFYRSPEGLAQQLECDLGNGRRVMVLAATGYMLDPLVAILRRNGVPFGNPYKEKHGGWNPLYGAQRVLAFLRPDTDAWGDAARMWTWADVFKWAEPLDAKAVFARGAKSFIEAKCLPDASSVDEPGSAQADTVLDLVKPEHHDLLVPYALGISSAGDVLAWYERHLRKTRAGQAAYAINVARRHGGRALHGAPKSVHHGAPGWSGIIVGTIHSVKGGEADTVYVFPDVSNAGFGGWLAPGEAHDAIARQFYVAFTRARDELVLCEPSAALAVPFEGE